MPYSGGRAQAVPVRGKRAPPNAPARLCEEQPVRGAIGYICCLYQSPGGLGPPELSGGPGRPHHLEPWHLCLISDGRAVPPPIPCASRATSRSRWAPETSASGCREFLVGPTIRILDRSCSRELNHSESKGDSGLVRGHVPCYAPPPRLPATRRAARPCQWLPRR